MAGPAAVVAAVLLAIGASACSGDEATPDEVASESTSPDASATPTGDTQALSEQCVDLIDLSVAALLDSYEAAADFEADDITDALETGAYPEALQGPFSLLIDTESQLVAASCPPSQVVLAQAEALAAADEPVSGGQRVLQGMLAQVAEQVEQAQ